MASPLDRLAKLDCFTTKGDRKGPDTSMESRRRDVSQTAIFGVGTSLAVEQSRLENPCTVGGGAISVPLPEIDHSYTNCARVASRAHSSPSLLNIPVFSNNLTE